MRVLVVIVWGLILACASPVGVSPEIETEALRFVAPEGKGRVYVYRPSIWYGDGELVSVEIGDISGALSPLSFMIADLKPGEYQLRAHATSLQVCQVQVEAGSVYFVRVKHTFGATRVTDAEGRAAIDGYRMVWSSDLPSGSSVEWQPSERRHRPYEPANIY